MSDETKLALEAMAIECLLAATSAEMGSAYYEAQGKAATASYFNGEKNAWTQAANMLRTKART